MTKYSYYDSLSAEEFQEFATEFISIKEKEQFYNNGLGKDKGIDFYNADGTIIGQVKNQKENFNTLKNSLKKEVTRVQKFDRYILITSQNLKKEQKETLIEMFSGHLKMNDIIDKEMLNRLLSKKEYHELELKYYQLYIPSSNILFNTIENIKNKSIHLQTQIELNEINKEKEIYAITDSYKQALENLLNKKVIIITGEPGIGKTTLGRMLIINLIKKIKNSEFIKVSSVDELYDVYQKNKNQIYFFDDFWGDTEYNLSISSEMQKKLYNFISLIEQENKYLIITSREYIFQEGLEINNKISNEFTKHQFLLKANDLSLITKFNILYNHIVNYPLSYEHTKILLMFYSNILNSPNYTPRLIHDFFKDYNKYKHLKPFDLYIEFMDYLKHPYEHFQKDLKKQPVEIKVLLLLIFLNEGQISIEKLKIDFNNIFKNTGDKFSDYITITENTFTNITKTKEPTISLKNPTYKDFLNHFLKENINFYFNYLTNDLTPQKAITLWKYVNYEDEKMKKNLEEHILNHLINCEKNTKYISILTTLVKTTNFEKNSKIKKYLISETEDFLSNFDDIMFGLLYKFDLDDIFNLLNAFKNKHDFSEFINHVLDNLVYESETFYQIDKLSDINELYPKVFKQYMKTNRCDIKKAIEDCIYSDINYYDMDELELENLIYEWVPRLYKNINIKMPSKLTKSLEEIYNNETKNNEISYPEINYASPKITPSKSNQNETKKLIDTKIERLLGKSHYIINIQDYMHKHHFNKEIIDKINNLQGPLFEDLKHNTIVMNLLNQFFETNTYINNQMFFFGFLSFIFEGNLKEINKLSYFAYKLIKNNEIVFTEEKLAKHKINPLDSKIIVKAGKWYYFCHPLLQTYLYLYYVSKNKKTYYIGNLKIYIEEYYNILNENTDDELNIYRMIKIVLPSLWEKAIVIPCIQNYLQATQKETDIKTAIQMIKYFNFNISYNMFEDIQSAIYKDPLMFDLVKLCFKVNMFSFIPNLRWLNQDYDENYEVNYYLRKKSIIKEMEQTKIIDNLLSLRNKMQLFIHKK